MPSVLLEDLLPVREPVSGWISASTAHRALKPFRTIREMRIYVGTGACIQEGGACVRGLKRGEREKRIKYNFKEEVKAQACESITRRTIYAQARAQFDMGIMKKRRSLWMT